MLEMKDLGQEMLLMMSTLLLVMWTTVTLLRVRWSTLLQERGMVDLRTMILLELMLLAELTQTTLLQELTLTKQLLKLSLSMTHRMVFHLKQWRGDEDQVLDQDPLVVVAEVLMVDPSSVQEAASRSVCPCVPGTAPECTEHVWEGVLTGVPRPGDTHEHNQNQPKCFDTKYRRIKQASHKSSCFDKILHVLNQTEP